MKLRPLLESPFRNYAVFSGRAGRAEFWLFILTFVVVTQLAWLVGFGAMKLVGFDRDHAGASPHYMMGSSEYGDAEQKDPDSAQADAGSPASGENEAIPDRKDLSSGMSGQYFLHGHDRDMMSFTIHRHGGDGYHLHGIMRDDHMFDDDREDLDDPDDPDRYDYRGGRRDGHFYVRFHKSRAERGGDVLWMISVAALLLPLFAVGARRLHDSNHSGWWQLLMLIPLAGWLVLAIFFLLPSDAQENRFGPTP